jgi:excinuclease ABC subunit A
VDKGNTVIVIEHNLDVIKSADWIVDMGPEGGSGGGIVVTEGTPEQVAADPDSYTGQFLAPVLAGHPAVTVGQLTTTPEQTVTARSSSRSKTTGSRAAKPGGRTTSTSGRKSPARTKASGAPSRKSA